MIADFAAALALRWSERRSDGYGFREAQASASEKPQGPAQRAGRNKMCLSKQAENSQYAIALQSVE